MDLLRIAFVSSAVVLAAVSGAAAQDAGAPSGSSPSGTYPMMNGWMMGSGMMGHQGMMGPGPMGPGMMGAYGQGAWNCDLMVANADGRLAYLKSALKISSDQETLWKAYADAARASAHGMVAHCQSMTNWNAQSPPSLPDRLAAHEELMQQRLDAIKATDKALKPLYEAFTADQKKLADQLLWGPMGMM